MRFQAEDSRRLGLSVARFEREAMLRGEKDPKAGPFFGFFLKTINLNRIERTLEGAMERCKYVPIVCIQLKAGHGLNRTRFPEVAFDGRYAEYDYIGIRDGMLLVGVRFWRKRGVYFHIRLIPLDGIEALSVGYEAKWRKAVHERTRLREKYPATTSSMTSERRVTQ